MVSAAVLPTQDLFADRSDSMPSNETVTELVGRAASGHQDAWDALVGRYENLLWSVGRAHRLDTADAADVVQTTWLRLLENLDRIEDPERLAGWLVTTARRECLRLLRRAGREVPDDLAVDLVDDVTPPPDAALLEQERDVELWRCFGLLPERCQRLLRVLMASEPPAYSEVSAALGMPIGAIGPTRMRCLNKLRALTGEAQTFTERTSR
jgi:RNA polymerase sigma factor (sigma-70 family)